MSLSDIKQIVKENDRIVKSYQVELDKVKEVIFGNDERINTSVIESVKQLVSDLQVKADKHGLTLVEPDFKLGLTANHITIKDSKGEPIGSITIGTRDNSPVRRCEDTNQLMVLCLYSPELLEATDGKHAFDGTIVQGDERRDFYRAHRFQEEQYVQVKGQNLPVYRKYSSRIGEGESKDIYLPQYITREEAIKLSAPTPYYDFEIFQNNTMLNLVKRSSGDVYGERKSNRVKGVGRTDLIALVNFQEDVLTDLDLFVMQLAEDIQAHDLSCAETNEKANGLEAKIKERNRAIEKQFELDQDAILSDIVEDLNSEEGLTIDSAWAGLNELKEEYQYGEGKYKVVVKKRTYYNSAIRTAPYLKYWTGDDAVRSVRCVRVTKSGKSGEFVITRAVAKDTTEQIKLGLVKMDEVRYSLRNLASQILEDTIIKERPELFKQEEVQA
jgi:hypothetical protein